VTRNDGGRQNYLAIYKDGQKRKLKEEREGVESWHQIYPGLAPKILSYRKRGQSAALLIEHLPGLTFEQILLRESPQLLAETLGQLTDTLASVWQATRSDKGVGARFMDQTRRRLGDVYAIHREFRQGGIDLCGVRMDGIDQLLRLATERESRIKTPFSVYIHGDFNVDNILYDALEKKINFIDLHRSCHLDYVQDVSVFMVSNYRLQIVDAPTRRRIMSVVRDFYDFAAGFAAQSGDRTFDLRLALGLARSFITSTRFILDQSLARAMFLRGRYLIEQVLAVSSGGAKDYRLPIREIFIE
jgi:aminoglycoside phosphotransferase (APT) family kinase protein